MESAETEAGLGIRVGISVDDTDHEVPLSKMMRYSVERTLD